MSSILKALRKLEEEKAAMGEGRTDLARDILKRSAPRRNSASSLALKVVFFLLLSIGLVVILWLLIGSSETDPTATLTSPPARPAAVEPVRKIPIIVPPAPEPNQAQAQPRTENPPSTETVPPAERPVSEPKVAEVKIEPVVIPLPPATKREAVEQSAASKVARSAPTIAVPEIPVVKVVPVAPPFVPDSTLQPAPETTPVAVPSSEAISPLAEPSPAAASPEVVPASLPVLTVTAVAYRPKPEERLAVVNDLPVMEGTSIDGVQIVEILPEGVRFSWQGQEFVLPVTGPKTLD